MASIPNNGYAAVMAGSNVYTGSNLYGSICPQTPIPPATPPDLVNKLYVDTLVGPPSGVGLSQVLTVGNNATGQDILSVNNMTVQNVALNSVGGFTNISPVQLALTTFNSTCVYEGGSGISQLATPTPSDLNLNNQGIGYDITVNTSNNAPKGQFRVRCPTVPYSIRDSALSLGTAGQVLTSLGTGAPYGSFNPQNLLWQDNVTSITAGTNIDVAGTPTVPIIGLDSPLTAPLDVGSQDITSTTSAIDIIPLAGQDCNVIVSGAGGLHIQQASAGGQANPSCRITNSNATGAVAMEVYKNKPTAGVAGDVLFNQSVYGKDGGNNKQEYTRISHSLRDGSAGVEDGSIEFGAFVNGSFANFLQINGNENEMNALKPLDMTGNNIRSSTGSMTITTALSTGLGNITAVSKGDINLTASGNLNLNLPSGGDIAIGSGISGTDITINGDSCALTSGTGLNIGAVFTNPGSCELYADAPNGMIINGLNRTTPTAGGASGQFLNLTVNGVPFKIALLNP